MTLPPPPYGQFFGIFLVKQYWERGATLIHEVESQSCIDEQDEPLRICNFLGLTLLNDVQKCKIGFEGHTSAEVDRAWMKKNLVEVIHEVESQSGNDEQEEPIIHGFKHTAFQYQSEKKSFKFSKDR